MPIDHQERRAQPPVQQPAEQPVDAAPRPRGSRTRATDRPGTARGSEPGRRILLSHRAPDNSSRARVIAHPPPAVGPAVAPPLGQVVDRDPQPRGRARLGHHPGHGAGDDGAAEPAPVEARRRAARAATAPRRPAPAAAPGACRSAARPAARRPAPGRAATCTKHAPRKKTPTTSSGAGQRRRAPPRRRRRARRPATASRPTTRRGQRRLRRARWHRWCAVSWATRSSCRRPFSSEGRSGGRSGRL